MREAGMETAYLFPSLARRPVRHPGAGFPVAISLTEEESQGARELGDRTAVRAISSAWRDELLHARRTSIG